MKPKFKKPEFENFSDAFSAVERPAAEWYWNHFVDEIDRRIRMIPLDGFSVEIMVRLCLIRDELHLERPGAGEFQSEFDEMFRENSEHLSDLMDYYLLPPDFGQKADYQASLQQESQPPAKVDPPVGHT